jgi:hypothetical protein
MTHATKWVSPIVCNETTDPQLNFLFFRPSSVTRLPQLPLSSASRPTMRCSQSRAPTTPRNRYSQRLPRGRINKHDDGGERIRYLEHNGGEELEVWYIHRWAKSPTSFPLPIKIQGGAAQEPWRGELAAAVILECNVSIGWGNGGSGEVVSVVAHEGLGSGVGHWRGRRRRRWRGQGGNYTHLTWSRYLKVQALVSFLMTQWQHVKLFLHPKSPIKKQSRPKHVQIWSFRPSIYGGGNNGTAGGYGYGRSGRRKSSNEYGQYDNFLNGKDITCPLSDEYAHMLVLFRKCAHAV